MGSAGTRFGRNVPVELTYPENELGAAQAQPAHGQPRAADAPRVPAGDHAQRAGGGLAPVHDPRLVQPRQEREGEPVGTALWPRTIPGPGASDADPAHPARPDPPAGTTLLAPTLPQHRDPLVGRLPDLRQQRRDPATSAVRRGRQARRGAGRPAPGRARSPRASPGAGLLGRAGAVAHALHARAQRDLRPPPRRVSRPGPTTTSSSTPG